MNTWLLLLGGSLHLDALPPWDVLLLVLRCWSLREVRVFSLNLLPCRMPKIRKEWCAIALLIAGACYWRQPWQKYSRTRSDFMRAISQCIGTLWITWQEQVWNTIGTAAFVGHGMELLCHLTAKSMAIAPIRASHPGKAIINEGLLKPLPWMGNYSCRLLASYSSRQEAQ